VAHQANLRILTRWRPASTIPLERFVLNIERYGNTSSASHPHRPRRGRARRPHQARPQPCDVRARRRDLLGRRGGAVLMDAAFWLARWEEGRIGFHEAEGSDLLRRFLGRLADAPAAVLVPLCGKAVDLRTLAAAGHQVHGVDLSPLAATAFFEESGASPERDAVGPFERLRGGAITYLVGDIFGLTPEHLGPVQAIFDRAALVALSPEDRERYVDLLSSCLAPGGRLLLVAFDYDQALAPGPPFSVPTTRCGASLATASTSSCWTSAPRPPRTRGSRAWA
jgi:thiopurine S-methyltransferase